MATGAVIVGRRTFDIAGQWGGDHHDGVPIFVVTHAAPDEPAPGHARYVTDGIASCVAQAKAAAGGRDILLHGAALAQEFLRAGLLDEMSLQVVPVLLGQGRRLFDNMPPEHIELELLRELEGPGALQPSLPRARTVTPLGGVHERMGGPCSRFLRPRQANTPPTTSSPAATIATEYSQQAHANIRRSYDRSALLRSDVGLQQLVDPAFENAEEVVRLFQPGKVARVLHDLQCGIRDQVCDALGFARWSRRCRGAPRSATSAHACCAAGPRSSRPRAPPYRASSPELIDEGSRVVSGLLDGEGLDRWPA